MECCYVPMAILFALASGAPPHPIRQLSEGILISSADPALRFRADTGFTYLGKVPIRIDDIAAGERHVFVDAEGQHVRRLLILQFEGYGPRRNVGRRSETGTGVSGRRPRTTCMRLLLDPALEDTMTALLSGSDSRLV
jgi:hypothetical protein